jgi:hypothetical protein
VLWVLLELSATVTSEFLPLLSLNPLLHLLVIKVKTRFLVNDWLLFLFLWRLAIVNRLLML